MRLQPFKAMAGQAKLTVLVCMFLCMILGVYKAYGDKVPQIIVNDWTQCDVNDNAFVTLWNLSVRACLLECDKRKRCKALNFMRGVQECELLKVDSHDEIDVDKQRCIHIRKADNIGIHPVPSQCADCPAGRACDLSTGSCQPEECPKLKVSHAIVAGNMNIVGSVVQVIPETGYRLGEQSARSVCQKNGNWDNIPEPEREDHCDASWLYLEETSSCYLEIITPMSYDSATSNCVARDAHLAYIESDEENTLVKELLSAEPWWIGVKQMDGVWVYTGTTYPITFEGWRPDEPNNEQEMCVELHTTGWNDAPCSWELNSICEKRRQFHSRRLRSRKRIKCFTKALQREIKHATTNRT